MLPSANRPREQEAGGHVGREQPAVSGEHDPIRRPGARSRAAASSSTTAAGLGGDGGAPAGAQRERARLLGPAAPARAARTRPRPELRPRPRRCSARACARSTSGGRPVWPCAAQPIAEVLALAPVQEVVAALLARAGPSSTPRTTRARPRRAARRRAGTRRPARRRRARRRPPRPAGRAAWRARP